MVLVVEMVMDAEGKRMNPDRIFFKESSVLRFE